MKQIFHIVAVSLVLFPLSSCDPKKTSAESSKEARPLVFVSLPPVATLVQEIAGEGIEVRSLVGEAQDPHSFAVETNQVMELGRAKVFFLCGMPFEEPLAEKLVEKVKVVALVEDHHHDHEHDDHDHAECAHSHLWLAPAELAEMAKTASESLQEAFPSKKDEIANRTDVVLAKLESLGKELAEELKPYSGKEFFVYHGAFDAFAFEFDLVERAMEVEGKSPTVNELQSFIEDLKKSGAKAFIVQPQFEQTKAKEIAKNAGVKVIEIDPMARDVLKNIRVIAQAVEESLR